MPNGDGIEIDYDEVFSKTAQLRSYINAEMGESDKRYSQLLASLENLDSATNGSMKVAMEREREKSRVTAEVAYNLLVFIDAAARRVQERERVMASLFIGQTME